MPSRCGGAWGLGQMAICRQRKPIGTPPFDFGAVASAEGPPELAPKPPKSIWFDPHRRCASETLKGQVDRLRVHLEAREDRRRKRRQADQERFALAVEVLACNLLVNAMVAPDRALAVPRSQAVMHQKRRHKAPVYGDQFLQALDAMIGADLISQPQRGYNLHKAGAKASTLLRIRPALAEHLPVGATTWDDFRREPWGDVLILKAPKRVPKNSGEVDPSGDDGDDPAVHLGARINFEPTPETEALERQVIEINRLLAEAALTVDIAALSEPIDENGRIVDPTLRQVRRIFNNGRWTHGGRLFHGFWETMAKPDRFAALRIEGEPVANVDFAQLFPRLAYVRCGAVPVMADLYEMQEGRRNRAGWKQLFGSLLFADGAMGKWPRGTAALFEPPLAFAEAVGMIEARHPLIAPLFGTMVGFEFMRIESKILIDALPELFARGIVALPLHDSVLTAASKAEAAKAVLEAAYRRHTGASDAFVGIEYPYES